MTLSFSNSFNDCKSASISQQSNDVLNKDLQDALYLGSDGYRSVIRQRQLPLPLTSFKIQNENIHFLLKKWYRACEESNTIQACDSSGYNYIEFRFLTVKVWKRAPFGDEVY